MIPKIEKTVRVSLPPRDAFDVFVKDMSRWWPLETHSLSAADGKTARSVTVEPRKGGKITETKSDGSTADWATITDWTPGARFAFDWYVGRDPADATTVSVTFMPEHDGTRIDLVHDGFDRLSTAQAKTAESYRSGWDAVLQRFLAFAPQRQTA